MSVQSTNRSERSHAAVAPAVQQAAPTHASAPAHSPAQPPAPAADGYRAASNGHPPASRDHALESLARMRESATVALPQTVRKGSKGPAVAELQAHLKAAGFDPGPVDGDFGPRTDKAVRAYQQAHHLVVDGIVGPQTWGSLLKSAPSPHPAPAPGGTGGTGGVGGDLPKTGNSFIDHVAAGAVAGAHKWSVPASVSIAQAILESGWGKSKLATEANNLFGMKGKGPAGSYNCPTKEYVNGHYVWINADFQKFHSQAEALEKHAQLLGTSRYYEKARKVASDPRAFANALTGVYATAPNYGHSLIQIMDQYNLYRFDRV